MVAVRVKVWPVARVRVLVIWPLAPVVTRLRVAPFRTVMVLWVGQVRGVRSQVRVAVPCGSVTVRSGLRRSVAQVGITGGEGGSWQALRSRLRYRGLRKDRPGPTPTPAFFLQQWPRVPWDTGNLRERSGFAG